jgi:hypothetical protein
MNPDHVRGFGEILRRNSIRFVLVGGAAVRHFYPSESQGVDALLMAKGYDRAIELLDKDAAVVSFAREEGRMATGHFHSRFRLVRFDLLNPEAFSGSHSGDSFFDYVSRSGSLSSDGIRLATVPVVWYMRLAIEGDAWTAQIAKILRDVRAGAPWGLKRDVMRVARRFGLGSRTSERWLVVEESARRARLFPVTTVDRKSD